MSLLSRRAVALLLAPLVAWLGIVLLAVAILALAYPFARAEPPPKPAPAAVPTAVEPGPSLPEVWRDDSGPSTGGGSHDSRPDLPPLDPGTLSITLERDRFSSDRGGSTFVDVACRDGFRTRAPIVEGEATVEGMPEWIACSLYFKGYGHHRYSPVYAGQRVRCRESESGAWCSALRRRGDSSPGEGP